MNTSIRTTRKSLTAILIAILTCISVSAFSNDVKLVKLDELNAADSIYLVERISLKNGAFHGKCKDSAILGRFLQSRIVKNGNQLLCSFVSDTGLKHMWFSDVHETDMDLDLCAMSIGNCEWRIKIFQNEIKFLRSERKLNSRTNVSDKVEISILKSDIVGIEFELPLAAASSDSILKYDANFRSCMEIERNHIYKINGINKDGMPYTSYATSNRLQLTGSPYKTESQPDQKRTKIMFSGISRWHDYSNPSNQLDSAIYESNKRRDSLLANCNLPGDTTEIDARTSLSFSEQYFSSIQSQINKALERNGADSTVITLHKNLRFSINISESNIYIVAIPNKDTTTSTSMIYSDCRPCELPDQYAYIVVKKKAKKPWELIISDFYKNIKEIQFETNNNK